MKVFLTGVTGFVGHGMLPELVSRGHEVVCIVRPGSEQKMKPDPAWQGRVRLVPGDLFDPASLLAVMNGCDAVVHLVGIIREQPGRGITFNRIHVEGTRNVIEAAKQVHVKKFVLMSALGSRPNATSLYHQTKYEAEQLLIASGLPHTIFRPSVIYGPGDEFVNMLADLVRLPLTPVIGDGLYRLQPVSRQIVAEVFADAVHPDMTNGQVFEVGGPVALTYNDILAAIGRVLGKAKVRRFHVPITLMKPVVELMQGFSFFPITKTQLIMLQEGNACADTESLYRSYPIKRIPFEDGIAAYLK
ncbi:complex I NDUFA9 subunit family protein [Brevibacillus dissolubilis]|uniref:complex I NDUFA9 subunit family protein n=1 Tax=Brevibacillus dissolubilis TaxID=1844116 RepID=UPI00111787B3|nr:complex I NDUFA9 subunit family protein [Brevibacillus dissolubilis]